MKKLYLWILFFALIFVFFYRQIFGGEVVYCCDNLLINIPSKLFLIEALRHGRFPLWNPYIFSGSPFLADLNLALLYPLNVFYFLLPAFRALTTGIIVNFLIALIGMYVFARSLKLSSHASALAAIVFGFSGTMVVYTNNVPMLQVASLVPWVVWSVRRYLLLPSGRSLSIAVIVTSLQIVAGHPQLTYYTWLLIAGFIVWTLTPTRALLLIVLFALLIFLVTAIQVVPFAEFVRLSTRVGRGFDYTAFDSLHPLSVIRFILPNSVGVLSQGTAWARGGSVYGFTGLISLLFAFFAPRKNRYVRFFSIAAIISFLLALGSYTPVFRFAYIFIPGIASFRSPQHFLLPYTFSIAVLAGFGLNYWRESRWLRRVIGGIGIMGGIGGILLLVNAPAFPWAVAQLAVLSPMRVLEKLHGFPDEMMVTIIWLIGQNLLVTSGILLVATFLLRKKRKLLIVLVFLELFLFSRNNLLSVSHDVAQRWLGTVQEKAAEFDGVDFRQYRVYTDPSIYPYPGKKQFGVFDWDRESAWQAEILRPNLNMVAHLPAIDGYASLIYRNYAEYLNTKQADPTGVTLDDPTGAKKKRLGVVPAGSPRLFFVKDGKEATEGIDVEKYTANGVSVRVRTEQPARLIFVDTNYPGWEGFIDGKPVVIQPFETVFKSIAVPAGTHSVIFRYSPKSVQIGLAMSGLGILVIVVLFWKRGKA